MSTSFSVVLRSPHKIQRSFGSKFFRLCHRIVRSCFVLGAYILTIPKSSFGPFKIAQATWLSKIVPKDKIISKGETSKVVPP